MQSCTFKTIETISEGLYKDKGSKFIAYAYPVECESEIKQKIDFLKKEHHSARHHCWAYRMGNTGEFYRAFDDGEPSHSAGNPILGQIDSFSLTNILIVVVRYFGGTLLGVGGLMQAYKESAKDALTNARIIEKSIQITLSFQFAYEHCNTVITKLKQYNSTIISQNFDAICSIVCNISIAHIDVCIAQLTNIPNIQISKIHG